MRPSLRCLIGILSFAAGVAPALPAEATSERSPPHCAVRLLPATVTTVPENAPALLVGDDSFDAKATLDATFSETDGTWVARAQSFVDVAGATALPLPASLQAGRAYDLQVAIGCSDTAGVPLSVPLPITSRFVAGEAIALPTAVGTLRMSTLQAYRPEVTVVPSKELRAYLAVAVLSLTVDGALQGRVFGEPDVEKIPFTANVAVACIGSGTAFRGGKRTAEVVVAAHVAGAESDPAPATTRVEVDCDSLEAERLRRQTIAPENSEGSKGCNVAARGGARGSGFLLCAGLVLAALGVARFRRRASHPSS